MPKKGSKTKKKGSDDDSDYLGGKKTVGKRNTRSSALREQTNASSRKKKQASVSAESSVAVVEKENPQGRKSLDTKYNKLLIDWETYQALHYNPTMELLMSELATRPFGSFLWWLFQSGKASEGLIFPSVEQVLSKYVQVIGTQLFIPLYFLQVFGKRDAFKYISYCSRDSKKLFKFDNIELKTSFQFYICFYDGPSALQFSNKTEIGRVLQNSRQSIFQLIKSQFSSFRKDKEESLYESLKHGHAFIIYGFHQTADSRHAVACILFSADVNGIYVNWLVVSDGTFNVPKFGTNANGQQFQNCGLGSFLLMLTQIRSAVLGWSTDIYLQVNKSSPAAKFYEQVGFQRTASNEISELPGNWPNKIATKDTSLYIKFVPDEVNAIDTKPECYLHLYQLSSFITEAISSKDLLAAQDYQIVPKEDSDVMFQFPFQVLGHKLDLIGQGLTIFGNPFFWFKDAKTMVSAINCRSFNKSYWPYQTAVITKKHYKELRENCKSEEHNQWLYDEEINLCLQWFVRDYHSLFLNGVEIIRSDFMRKVEDFYGEMMNNKQVILPMPLAFEIHTFLMNKAVSILEKRFVIFVINDKDQHWITCVYCNPWYTVANNMKKKCGSTITTEIENIDDHYHGWLIYDPLHGFLGTATSGVMKGGEKKRAHVQKRVDMLVWFMNMASLYCNCHHENTANIWISRCIYICKQQHGINGWRSLTNPMLSGLSVKIH